MKITYIHYHLKTGGVTTVLRHQVAVLRKTDNILVLTGEPSQDEFPATTVVIEGLSYDTPTRASPPASEVADAIIATIHSHFNGPCDLLHIHNPTIAKNRNLLKIIKRLQQAGITLLLQVHDLAEDGRPALFYDEPYPPDCHFGVINNRDYGLLRQGGLSPEGLHLLPNMVEGAFSVKEHTGSAIFPKNYVLYPVRAIRRKNIGEAVLLSLFFKNNETLVITLPPNSPADISSYKGWRHFVQSNNLRVLFEAGRHQDFDSLVLNAQFLITTSIAEGFGFSFLTPWLAGKLIWGRKLPDICSDFEDKGVVLDHLYSELSIPLDWLPRESLYSRWKTCMRTVAAHYRQEIDAERIDASFSSVTTNDRIDFGLLDESYQKRVIARIVADPPAAAELVRMNPFLARPADGYHLDRLIENNSRAVAAEYNAVVYRKTLQQVYDRVVGNKVTQRLNSIPLLNYFLNPINFSLLKWCSYVDE